MKRNRDEAEAAEVAAKNAVKSSVDAARERYLARKIGK